MIFNNYNNNYYYLWWVPGPYYTGENSRGYAKEFLEN